MHRHVFLSFVAEYKAESAVSEGEIFLQDYISGLGNASKRAGIYPNTGKPIDKTVGVLAAAAQSSAKA
jgi:hypothetical protein